jgi:FkbM family methyltransferase
MKEINGWVLPDFDHLLSKYANKSQYPKTEYQQGILNEALKFVENFDQAIDIGANIGFHTVRFSYLFNSVKSFEPAQCNYDSLKENTKKLKNVEIFKLGVGDVSAEMKIELPKNSVNCGAFSFKDFLNCEEEKISEKVKVVKLDDFNFFPNLIKIDTQGFEKNVLIGSIETLKKSKPVILAEVAKKGPTQELLDILKPLGYYLSAYSNSDKVFSIRK